jgi:7,8-dihydropterin-6-yl-methyl-4-(beta-D-ribofuranosyl)aminobenzene 5'-phosphate synthase
MNMDKIYMVFGGFHLGGLEREDIGGIVTDLKAMGVEKAGPTHCSGEKARRVFSGQYHKNFIAVKAGHIIHL